MNSSNLSEKEKFELIYLVEKANNRAFNAFIILKILEMDNINHWRKE